MAELTMHLEGLTCHNCVNHVTEELMELEGVKNVDIALNAGGTSVAHIDYEVAPSEDQLRAAVAEAGDYEITQIQV